MSKWLKGCAMSGICCLLCGLILTGCTTSLAGKQENEQSGDRIELESLTLSIQNCEVGQEVAPDHPEGYYDYYEPHKGYEYYIVSGQANNTGSSDIQSGNVVVQALVEQKATEAKILFLNETGSQFTESLKAGETREFKLFMIKRVEEQIPQAFVFYYNQWLDGSGEGKSYDYKTTVTLNA